MDGLLPFSSELASPTFKCIKRRNFYSKAYTPRVCLDNNTMIKYPYIRYSTLVNDKAIDNELEINKGSLDVSYGSKFVTHLLNELYISDKNKANYDNYELQKAI